MTTVASARRDWEAGYRRFLGAAADPARADELHRQLDAITGELRRRVGATFTLDELAAEYDQVERWLHGALEGDAPSSRWVRTANIAADAAFHAYSRGARDYEP